MKSVAHLTIGGTYDETIAFINPFCFVSLPGCTQLEKASSSHVPQVLQVGKSYDLRFGQTVLLLFRNTDSYKVLEIDQSGWIKVQTISESGKKESVAWVNVAHILAIIEKQ